MASRRSRPIDLTIDPILKKIFEKYSDFPFNTLSKAYAFPELELMRYFQANPKLLTHKQFELIYQKLLQHKDEIINSTQEPYVRKRFNNFIKEFERLPLLEEVAPG